MTFHFREGFYFSRATDGSVTIRVAESAHGDAPTLREITVPENEWASVLASVCARGESGETWQEAREFHGVKFDGVTQ
jgi:hypothetical protein